MTILRFRFLLLACLLGVSASAQLNAVHVSIVNEPVSRYLNEVIYTDISDVSRVEDYLTDTQERLDLPLPAIVAVPNAIMSFVNKGIVSFSYSTDENFSAASTHQFTVPKGEESALVYDVQPGVPCYYRFNLRGMLSNWGTIVAEPQLRMIYLPSLNNVRDLGGWPVADGRTIRYGKLIRGVELDEMHPASSEDISHLLDLGVSAELDLRADYEGDHQGSVFGFKSAEETAEGEIPTYLYTNDSGQLLNNMTQYSFLRRWKQEFEFIVQNLRAGHAVYFHCRWGIDRTGYLSLLLEGLLGVEYDGLIKDYELSSFSAGSNKKKETIDPVVKFIQALSGNTLQEKFRTFWKSRVGVSDNDIDYFIEEMLEGEKLPVEEPIVEPSAIVSAVASPRVEHSYGLDGRLADSRGHGVVLRRHADGGIRKVFRND